MAMKRILPWLSSLLLLIPFSSCRESYVSPVRNIRFDPGLLNKMQVAGDACNSYSYFDGAQTIQLGTVYTRQVLVIFNPELTAEAQQEALQQLDFVAKLGQDWGALQLVELQEGLSCKQVEQAMLLLAADTHIQYVAPLFANAAQLLGTSNEVVVTIEQASLPILYQLVKAYKAEVTPTSQEGTYVVRVNKQSKGNALELANFLQTQAGIVLAVPTFILAAN